MSNKKIIGICLLRNDDRFLDQILNNISDFCDELIIADHCSKDQTVGIAQKWASGHDHIHYHKINHPSESHELIREFCSKDVWMFAVDGDEIYERDRLAVLKKQLLAGRFEDKWQIMGKALHCCEYQEETSQVKGYLARPSRPMTKLYNFSHIHDWKGPCSERLHHGEILFKEGYESGVKDESESEKTWEDAVFRCLHMVFIRRSSLQKDGDVSRPNIAEINHLSKFRKILFYGMRFFGFEPVSKTKHLTYMRGECVSKDARSFFVKDLI